MGAPTGRRRERRDIEQMPYRENLEFEAKLVAPDAFELPDLNGLGSGIVAAAPTVRHLTAVYYDTSDLRLARAGVTLRHRTGESGEAWTLKLPQSNDTQTLTRHEIMFDDPPGTVPAAARDLLRVHIRGGSLAPVVRLRTARTAVALRDATGQQLAEVVDDAVKVYEGQRLTRRFREIEVEASDGRNGAKVLRRAVERLIDAGCHAEPPVPKAIRALGPRAQADPEVVVPEIGPDATVGLLLRHVVARSVAEIVRHDPGVRLGDDPEDVHRFRVGARRLRSDLRTFTSLLAPDWTSHVRAELAWLGAEVGAVRDADVLVDRLRSQAATLPEQDGASAAALLQHLVDQRATRRATMLESLRSPRYDALIEQLMRAADQPPVRDGMANRPAHRHVGRLVRRPWRQLVRAADALRDEPSDEDLHKLRILAKHARYATEAVTPVTGHRASRFAAAIAEVQTVLGDHQDAIVAEEWLRAAAANSPDNGVVAGQLVAVQRHERAQLRKLWPTSWRAAAAPKLRTWL